MSLTFEDNDALNRKPFADRLTKAVTTFYPFADGAYVLSLNAEFGAGKTTFLEMWKHDLENDYTVIFINAWETDFAQNPAIPIISAFLEQLPEDADNLKKLKEGLLGGLGAVLVGANSAFAAATKVDLLKTLSDADEETKPENQKLINIGKGLDKLFHHQQKTFEIIREQLKTYVESLNGKPLIVMVDELDRARPDYAVEFLETIKHLFSVQGVVFVLAVNKKQLESSVKVLFGEGTNFENYYRRFITREVDLPEPEIQDWEKFIEHQYKEYFEDKLKKQLQFVSKNIDKHQLLNDLSVITKLLDLNLRETQSFFRVLCHLLLANSEIERKSPQEVWAGMFMCALFIKRNDLYRQFGRAELDRDGLKKLVESFNYSSVISICNNLENNFYRPLFASVLNSRSYKAFVSLLKQKWSYDISKARDEDIIRELLGVTQPPQNSLVESAYERIENWKTFFAE